MDVVKYELDAIIPTRATVRSAGLDLYSPCEYTVTSNTRKIVNIGIGIKLPTGTYGQILSRSSLALNGIYVVGGVIDEDYRGPIKVILHNDTDKDYVVNKGDRIAQLLCIPIIYPNIVYPESLPSTERGKQGIGSSGR